MAEESLRCLNALISACLLSGTMTPGDRRKGGGGGRDLLFHSNKKTTQKPQEPGNNLCVLFPQVIPRSPVHGQADHCEKHSHSTPLFGGFASPAGYRVVFASHTPQTVVKVSRTGCREQRCVFFVSFKIKMPVLPVC